MKKIGFAFVLAATLGTSTIAMNVAQAAPLDASGQLNAAADGLNVIERTQFIFGGHRHCFYDNGWHGPGWYWCGYAMRQGFGWGGPVGWHNWNRGGPGGWHRGPRRWHPM
jgi:hypothetical protein